MTEKGIVARSKHLRRLLGRPALASPATDDAFPIVDASEKEVKQITYAELSAAIGSTVDIPDHNDLGGLNAGDYKHLTADEYSKYAKVTIGTTAPATPTTNELWIDTN